VRGVLGFFAGVAESLYGGCAHDDPCGSKSGCVCTVCCGIMLLAFSLACPLACFTAEEACFFTRRCRTIVLLCVQADALCWGCSSHASTGFARGVCTSSADASMHPCVSKAPYRATTLSARLHLRTACVAPVPTPLFTGPWLCFDRVILEHDQDAYSVHVGYCLVSLMSGVNGSSSALCSGDGGLHLLVAVVYICNVCMCCLVWVSCQ
jgi:hypothetical protein